MVTPPDHDQIDGLAAARSRVLERIAAACERAGRDPAGVTLVAVSKTHGPERVREVLDAGHRVFGENRVQEAQEKFPALKADYPDLVRATTRARRTMTDYVRGLVDAGVLTGDPILIGHVFWSALHGAVVLQLAGKLGDECSFETISGEAFRALSVGFAPKG